MTIEKIGKAPTSISKMEDALKVTAKDYNVLVDFINATTPSLGAAKSDTISEYTAGEGVAIDSVLMKDGGITHAVGISMRVPFIPVAGQQAISGAGAINTSAYYTALTTTAADAYTLAAGSGWLGQLKKIKLIVDGGTATITVTGGVGFNTIVMDDAGDYIILMYTSSGWYPIEAFGCTTSTA